MAPGILEPSQLVAIPPKITSLAHLTEEWDDTLRFYLNGTKVTIDSVDPEFTLLEYLRAVGLKGTKLGCAEGGCGACTVVVSQLNPTTKKLYHASVNACLAPLVSVDGKHVVTVEGIGDVKNPHAVQQRIAVGNGSQCGFCTPGFVMSLYALLRNNPEPSEQTVEEAFDGNLCRCTGYRPILDAAQSFNASNACGKSPVNGGSGCCMEKQNGFGGGCCKGPSASDQKGGSWKALARPDFIPYSPDTELIFPPALRRHDFRPLAFGNKRKKWYRPVTLQQLLEVKSAHPAAKIISGSTETQIETKFKAVRFDASVYVGDIAELRQYSFKNDHLEIGANVCLTDLENICDEAVKRYGQVQGQSFKAVKKQLDYFAGRQIRNVASPAGNLATASPISDLNPVFVATNTVLMAKSLGKEIEIPMTDFFKGYRSTALPPDAVIASLRIPISRKGEYIRAYKQSKRKDDDIAIVNAALRVSLSPSKNVESVNLVFGGMAPMTVSAKKAEAFLAGKKFTSKATLEGVMSALERDFDLKYGVPGGMATYRKSLALGFFYRFYHDVLRNLEVGPADVDEDGIAEIERAISSGRKDHEPSVAYEQNVLGKATPHVSAMKQATGEAQYTDDIPVQQNELFGSLVTSTKAHAKIIKVDATAALEIPGVRDFVSHEDLPSPAANFWGIIGDEPFFAVNKVTTAGQPIGVILATTEKAAEQGSRAVKVEYEDLPVILTIEEAIEKESYFSHERFINTGDTSAAFEQADYVFAGDSRMGGQEHFYLETQACVAIPKPEDGEMEVWSSTQNPTETQEYVAQVTGVAAHKVVSRVKRLGGGFGGKETRSVQLASICALAATKTRRPVRCMLNRDEDIAMSGQRHPFFCKWKVGVTKTGKLLALDADVFANGGFSLDLSGGVLDRALTHIDNVYKIPNVHVRGRICKTNTTSNTAFRGFGGPQGLFFAECFMEEIADNLDMPVEQLREMNLYKPDDLTHFNQELKDWHVPLMYKQVMEESSYKERRTAVDDYNRKHKWSKRGLSIIPTKFGISFGAVFLNQAGALVHVYRDGSVLVAHGGVEMGQGLHTKMTMIAAEALQVPQSSVFISETATNTVPNTSATAASAGSDLNGYAVFNACQQINERLQPYREKMPAAATLGEIAHAAWFDRVNLSAQGFYRTPDIGYVWGENTGQLYYYFTQGVTAAEVQIDTLTGDWTPLRADIKMDVGHSINPSVDYGQIEGAFIQGQGLFTTEESLWHRASGQLVTKGPGNYKIPGSRDIPQQLHVSLLKDVTWENLRTIQRSRGVGEPPLFMGSSVFFAIRDALKAARRQWGVDEVLSLRSPATPERIRVSCADPIIEKARVVPGEGERSFFVAI